MSEHLGRRAPLWAWWALVGAVHAAIFGPLAYRASFRSSSFVGPNLFSHHTWFSTFAFEDYWRPATPGYLFLVVARTINAVLRTTDPRVGAVVACVAFYALFGIAIFEVFRRAAGGLPPLRRWVAALASVLIALLESPAALRGWSRYVDGDIFMPLYLPFAPTTIGSLGLNVLLMLEVGRLMDGTLPQSSRWRVPLLMVLATIAKPTLAPLIVIVVVVSVIAERWVGSPGERGPLGAAEWHGRLVSVGSLVVLPGLLVLIPQYLATAYKVQYPRSGFDDRGGWVLHPLQELRDLNALTVLFWLALLFPVAALLLLRSKLWSDAAVRLGLLATALGIAMTLLLERTGSSDWKGDMLQLPAAAVAVLMVFIPRRIVELSRSGRISVAVVVVLALLLAPYLVAGVASWSCHVGLGCPAF